MCMAGSGKMAELEELAHLVLRLVDAGALNMTVAALQDGSLPNGAGAAARARVAQGRPGVEDLLKEIDAIWSDDTSTLDAAQFALLLSGAAAGASLQLARGSTAEVVWTGPKVQGSFLRATRQVIQDVIQGAHSDLLVVGYWLAGRGDREGIINDVIEQIAEAVERGVQVTMILDRNAEKRDGRNNLETLQTLWPAGVPMPAVLTWEVPEDDDYLKLHAKVLVADKSDALVTSANLTMYALDRNMEMGIRVSGVSAERIVQHFELLALGEVLVGFA
jgi:cardiolipin synthase A/B